MPEMSRRDWLTGTVLAVVGAQLTIATKASAEDIVVPDREVKIYNPDDMKRATTPNPDTGSLLFMMTEAGDYVPVGFVTRLTVERERLDATYLGGTERVTYPGTMRAWGEFECSGMGAFNIRQGMHRGR